MRILCTLLLFTTLTFSQTYQTLYSFQSTPDGAVPTGQLSQDSQGNLYGTTEGGGQLGYGTIYQLTPEGSETTLYSFGGPDAPTTGLTADSLGNLYGTTSGEANHCPPTCGTVWELSQGQFQTLYAFKGGKDGGNTTTPLVLDQKGNLYGATWQYGPKGYGTVFRLSQANGVWTKKILHAFAYDKYGAEPNGNLAIDQNGVIYGATSWAGGQAPYGLGTIFKLIPQPTGSYKIALVHTFGKAEKQTYAGVSLDSLGALYGTMPTNGGKPYVGTAWRATSKPTGGYTKVTIQRFNPPVNGQIPQVNPVSDAAGNLYGTDWEVCYELLPQQDGSYLFQVLNWFNNNEMPQHGTILLGNGVVYGTTEQGGNGMGTVYSIQP